MYMFISMCIYIYIYICACHGLDVSHENDMLDKIHQRGGAVETGCSGLHYIIGCFIIEYYPHPLHPPVMNTQPDVTPCRTSPPMPILLCTSRAKCLMQHHVTPHRHRVYETCMFVIRGIRSIGSSIIRIFVLNKYEPCLASIPVPSWVVSRFYIMYIYTYYIHTYIHMYLSLYIYIYIHTYICRERERYIYMYTYIHTYLHTYIHTYIHAYIHTYIHTCISPIIRLDQITWR